MAIIAYDAPTVGGITKWIPKPLTAAQKKQLANQKRASEQAAALAKAKADAARKKTVSIATSSGSGAGGGTTAAAPPLLKTAVVQPKPVWSQPQMSNVARGATQIANSGVNSALQTLRGVDLYEPQSFSAPFELGKYEPTQFNASCYQGQAETIADQAIREGKSANQVARERYLATYQNALDDIALQQSMAEQKNEAQRQGSLQSLQNMGANTGLGYGSMAQGALASSDTNFRGELNNLLQEYANQRGAYGREYQAAANETALKDRDLDAGRQAAIYKQLADLVGIYQPAWAGNEAARLGGYNASQAYLDMLGNQFYQNQGNQLTASGQRLDQAGNVADVNMAAITALINAKYGLPIEMGNAYKPAPSTYYPYYTP